jgi:hypothetical protein
MVGISSCHYRGIRVNFTEENEKHLLEHKYDNFIRIWKARNFLNSRWGPKLQRTTEDDDFGIRVALLLCNLPSICTTFAPTHKVYLFYNCVEANTEHDGDNTGKELENQDRRRE